MEGWREGGVCVVVSRLLKLRASGDEIGLSPLSHLARLGIYGNTCLRPVSQAILRTEDTGISKDPGVHSCTHVLRTPYSPILEYSERRHPAFLIENAPRPGSGMRCIRPSQSEAS